MYIYVYYYTNLENKNLDGPLFETGFQWRFPRMHLGNAMCFPFLHEARVSAVCYAEDLIVIILAGRRRRPRCIRIRL